jgi:hypothetical protein
MKNKSSAMDSWSQLFCGLMEDMHISSFFETETIIFLTLMVLTAMSGKFIGRVHGILRNIFTTNCINPIFEIKGFCISGCRHDQIEQVVNYDNKFVTQS